jgi:HSF-type DNA-binding
MHRFRSFQRQLCLYGFKRLTRKGPDSGSYYHECCLRGRSDLVKGIRRQRVKGWMVRQSSSPDTEPNFWVMPIVGMPELDPTPIAEHAQNPTEVPHVAGDQGKPPAKFRSDDEAFRVGNPSRLEMNFMVYPTVAHLGQVSAGAKAADIPQPYSLSNHVSSLIAQPSPWILLPISSAEAVADPESFVEKEALASFLSDVDLESCDGEYSDPMSQHTATSG